ncbi:hypothetical protein [Bradyrhizobium sp. SZCCHNS3004]|uniref:hypothetical protein n=1 Tax=Bradyrhizobium sp. SZCCHNS3004 TaxID=3057312 RepID=UPI002915CE53|nr:hypothetical protein [Bradyrhizobium sp. SZCCHNS3004]
MMIAIFNGDQLFETRACELVVLPDGRQGAIWRGLAYPLELPDHRIEIGSEAFAPNECIPRWARPAARRTFAVIEGVDEAYVLVSGAITDCEEASSRLKGAGYEVIRTGRYLGDPVEDFEADWFVRIVRPTVSSDALSTVLGAVFDDHVSERVSHQTLGEYRAQLIATELASAKAREAALRVEIARLNLESAKAAGTQAQIEELRRAVDLEREARQQADLAAAEAQESLNAARQNRPPPRVGKIRDEIEVVLAALIPEVRLIRDSLDVVAAEFINRRAFYRGLAELRTATARLPPTWKKLKGLEQWWERHMSDGQDDAGRIYVRFSATDRIWDVLISHKSEQSRDITWLDRQ